jgi:hypothetical protein
MRCTHRLIHVLAHRLGRFDVDVERAVLARPVQFVHQRQHARGLAGLARRVEHEVFALCDQRCHTILVHP